MIILVVIFLQKYLFVPYSGTVLVNETSRCKSKAWLQRWQLICQRGKVSFLIVVYYSATKQKLQVFVISLYICYWWTPFCFNQQAFPACSINFPTIGMSSDMTNPAYLQFNPAQQQLVACCGLDMGIDPPDMALKRTTSAPVSIPETFLDSSCFTVMPCSPFISVHLSVISYGLVFFSF